MSVDPTSGLFVEDPGFSSLSPIDTSGDWGSPEDWAALGPQWGQYDPTYQGMVWQGAGDPTNAPPGFSWTWVPNQGPPSQPPAPNSPGEGAIPSLGGGGTDLTGGTLNPMTGGSPPPPSKGFWQEWGPTLALGGVGALGVGALAQWFAQGDPQTKTTIQKMVAQRSPEEQQAFQTALQQFQAGGTALTGGGGTPGAGVTGGISPGGIQQGLLQRAMSATGPGGQVLDSYLPMLAQDLYRHVVTNEPTLSGGEGGLPQEIRNRIALQGGLAGILGPLAARLAGGNLPITPQLQETVAKAFQPSILQSLQAARERAQNLGWHDDSLNAPPAAAMLGPALASLQGQQAAATLDLARGLPMDAMQIMGALNPQIATLGSYQSSLENMRQGLLQGLGGAAQQQTYGTPLSVLQTLNNLMTGGVGIGGTLGNQRIGEGGTTQIQTGPGRTLFDILPGLGSLAGGAGQMLYGLGSMSGGQRTLSGWA